jgi:hypothetical protein
MLGRLIDTIARHGQWQGIDGLLCAQEWRTGAYGEVGGPRCFVGHLGCVDGGERGEVWSMVLYAESHNGDTAEARFDDLVRRFGTDRVVRAIKARAGKHTRITIPATPAPTECAVS